MQKNREIRAQSRKIYKCSKTQEFHGIPAVRGKWQ